MLELFKWVSRIRARIRDVLIASDLFAERSLKSRGGAGLAQAKTGFGPMLLKAGMSESVLDRIMVDNPHRLLAFVPKAKQAK